MAFYLISIQQCCCEEEKLELCKDIRGKESEGITRLSYMYLSSSLKIAFIRMYTQVSSDFEQSTNTAKDLYPLAFYLKKYSCIWKIKGVQTYIFWGWGVANIFIKAFSFS